jgi:hypothetical protein
LRAGPWCPLMAATECVSSIIALAIGSTPPRPSGSSRPARPSARRGASGSDRRRTSSRRRARRRQTEGESERHRRGRGQTGIPRRSGTGGRAHRGLRMPQRTRWAGPPWWALSGAGGASSLECPSRS